MAGFLAGGEGGVSGVSSVTGLIEEDGDGVEEEAGAGGVMEEAPWLFSERDVRDLMRLKKPLFLDSRFLSAPSGGLEDGPLTDGSLEEIEHNDRIRKLHAHMKP